MAWADWWCGKISSTATELRMFQSEEKEDLEEPSTSLNYAPPIKQKSTRSFSILMQDGAASSREQLMRNIEARKSRASSDLSRSELSIVENQ